MCQTIYVENNLTESLFTTRIAEDLLGARHVPAGEYYDIHT